MTNLVPHEDVPRIVGRPRHPTLHFGLADPESELLYILHSVECFESGRDLRECPFSLALDQGAPMDVWESYENQPVELAITECCGNLVPKEALL